MSCPADGIYAIEVQYERLHGAVAVVEGRSRTYVGRGLVFRALELGKTSSLNI